MDISGAFGALTKPFRKPEGYVSAMEEKAAAAKAAAPAPAPVAAGVPRLGGVNMDAMKRREAAAGLKDGGPVHGPGTGTSDSIPAKLSAGEFVLPADTVRMVGVETLQALVDATHKPVKAGVGKGPRKMVNGGSVGMQADIRATEELQKTNAMLTAPGPAAGVGANIPGAGGFQDRLNAQNAATAASSITNQVAPATGRVPVAMTSNPPAPDIQVEDTPPAQMLSFGVSRLRQGYADGGLVEDERKRLLAQIPGQSVVAPPAAGFGAVPARPPLTSQAETVLRQSSTDANAAAAKGNYGEAIGNAARGILGAVPALAMDIAAPFAPVARGVGNFASTLATGEPMQQPAAGAGFGAAPPKAARPPAQPAQPTPAATAAMGGAPQAAPGPEVPRLGATKGKEVQGAGGVYRINTPDGKTLYSNVGGDNTQAMKGGTVTDVGGFGVGQTSADRVAMLNRAADTYREISAMQQPANTPAGLGLQIGNDPAAVRSAQVTANQMQEQGRRTGGNAGAEMVRAGQAMNANAPAAGQNPAMAQAAAAQQAFARQQAEAQRTGAQTSLDGRRMAMAEQESRQKIGIGNAQQRQAAQVANLQEKFLATSDPKEREAIREQLLVVMGKDKDTPNRFTVVPGGQQAVDGQIVTLPARVLDNQTGRFVDQQGGQAPAAAAALPPKDQLKTGQVYATPRGNARWDGSKFIPV